MAYWDRASLGSRPSGVVRTGGLEEWKSMSDEALEAIENVAPTGPLTDLVDDYRRLRDELERSVLPLATSVDGRQFTFQASLHQLQFQTGGYVVLEDELGDKRLGQILTMRPDSVMAPDLGLETMRSSMLVRLARGEGVILDGDLLPFHDTRIRPAEASEVDAWLSRVRPNRSALTIGELLLAPGVPAALDSGGFNRHTFMCGQSGSGKTYSLGLVLERLLLGTSLRLIILDPNSDYIRLSEIRDNADPAVAAEYAAAASGVSVWQNDPERRIRSSCSSSISILRRRPRFSVSIRSVIARSTPRCRASSLPAKRAAL
jgi:Helicase HerA, central domain